MQFAIQLFGPAPWQCKAFLNGEPWMGVITGWKLECPHVTAPCITLTLTGTGELPLDGQSGASVPFSLTGKVTDYKVVGDSTTIEAYLPLAGK
jgi:hypothetical protein